MATERTNPLGSTGGTVPRLGLGCQPLGSPALSEAHVARLLHLALDLGVNLFDTAPAYQLSEERLGRHLAGRRPDCLLVTKLGYGVPGVRDWTGDCIRGGVDAALRRLGTDYLDIALLHSCDLATLRHSDVIEALVRARDQGKIRLAGYSGENEALDFAISTRAFQVIETSVNFLDQVCFDRSLPQAGSSGLGVLAKRPLANAVWREDVTGDAAIDEYRRRFVAFSAELSGDPDWPDVALRFAAFSPGIHCAMIGTTREKHLRAAVAAIDSGPLPEDVRRGLRDAWRRCGIGWEGVV